MPAPSDVDLIQRAISFACRAHAAQLRKDRRTPYAAHVMRVMMIVRHVFGCDDPVALAGAALHDTIEDTSTDYDDILKRFGEPVADTVAALTKNMILREDIREEDYDRRLAEGPWHARLVKLADVYDNICDAKGLAPEDARRRHVRAIERARRAIAIAEADVADIPATARAVAIVQELIDSYES